MGAIVGNERRRVAAHPARRLRRVAVSHRLGRRRVLGRRGGGQGGRRGDRHRRGAGPAGRRVRRAAPGCPGLPVLHPGVPLPARRRQCCARTRSRPAPSAGSPRTPCPSPWPAAAAGRSWRSAPSGARRSRSCSTSRARRPGGAAGRFVGRLTPVDESQPDGLAASVLARLTRRPRSLVIRPAVERVDGPALAAYLAGLGEDAGARRRLDAAVDDAMGTVLALSSLTAPWPSTTSTGWPGPSRRCARDGGADRHAAPTSPTWSSSGTPQPSGPPTCRSSAPCRRCGGARRRRIC